MANRNTQGFPSPEEDPRFHDTYQFLRRYRDATYSLKVVVHQMEHQFKLQYDNDIDKFLDSIYAAGADLTGSDIEQRAKSIARSNQMLKLLESSIDLLRNNHKHGEQYYWILYYAFLSPQEMKNTDEILDKLAHHITNISYRTYYRKRRAAIDIIRRTDRFLNFYVSAVRSHEDYIGCVNFENCLIQKNHYPTGYGWIRADGTIGANATTQKYPTVREFIEEWYKLLYAFPYLNLIIAVTGWNEGPWGDETVSEEEFCKEVAVGIYVHDRKIEILNPPNTIAKYKEYNKRYGTPPEKFEREYYEKHKYERYKTEQANPAYLRKCIEAYGLDADKILKRG